MANTKIRLTRTSQSVLVFVILAALAFLLCTNLSSYYFCPKAPQLDSSVFRYVGMVMQRGGVPYRDTFDHKGPLIYLFNYLGLFWGNNGIWFVELALMFLAVIFAYKTFRLFCNQPLSLIGTCVAMFLMYDYLGEGNYTEEYALPFIICAIYVYTEYFLKGSAKWYKIAICGACAMSVLLLRANMIGTWIVFSSAVMIREGKHCPKNIIPFILSFILGLAAMFLPFFTYFYANGALNDFWEQYIVFNMAYSSASGNKASAVRYFMLTAPSVIAILITLVRLHSEKDRDWLDWISLGYIVVSLCLIGISGRTYNHYGIILIPLAIIPLAKLYQYLSRTAIKRELMISSFVVLVLLAYPWVHGFANRNFNVILSGLRPEGIISEFIRNNTEEEDVIIQCGHKDVFYVLSDRMAASKYSYPLPIAMVDNRVYDEFFEDLREQPPTVIITDTWTEQDQLDYTEMNRRLSEYVEEFEYVKGPTVDTYTLYYRKGSYLANKIQEG